jgi:retron-type reverse transcriptase
MISWHVTTMAGAMLSGYPGALHLDVSAGFAKECLQVHLNMAADGKSKLDLLKAATTRQELAKLLDIKPSILTFILYKKDSALKYKTFSIPKRSGGTREINAPSDDLKTLQKALAVLLQECLNEIHKTQAVTDRVAHGFMPYRSIVTNAYPHRGRRYVFNIDLKDFFGSITFPRLRGFFIKDRNFSLNEKIATVLAQIACHEGKLPQGSPCSPIMSNLIGHILDMHLVRLAAENGCHYSRYADDLTFSTNKPTFPHAVARTSSAKVHEWIPGRQLAGLVKKCAFEINETKTRMQYRASRQEVTGLVVNTKINVRSEYRHLVRLLVNRVLKTGEFTFDSTVIDDTGVATADRTPGTLEQLHGMLGFIHGVDSFVVVK